MERKRVELALLVVEDDLLLGGSLSRALRGAFARVAVVTTQAAAVAALETFGYDVVLSDFDLGGGGNGGELLALVRARWPRARRVLYSANLAAAAEAAHAVLDKTVSTATLLAALVPSPGE